ncbi:MAG: hypothetical protein PHY62_05165 [Gallionella sp.]|nr:hypothetical protein [Gallionella sp.]
MSLVVVILFSVLYLLVREVFRRLPSSWLTFSVDGSTIQAAKRNGQFVQGQLMPGSVIFPFCLLLRIKSEGRGHVQTLVVFSDALNPDEYRRLCVQLNQHR